MSHSATLQAHIDSRSRAEHIGYPGSRALLTLKPLCVYSMAQNNQSVMHWPWALDGSAKAVQPKGGLSPNFATWNVFNDPVI